jgi:2-methylcitrate dehydratase PrpD
MIEDVYFKPYSCCRWAHAAIDGVIDIMCQEGISADAVVAVRIDTFARALSLNNDLAPRTLEAAQYSVPFCIAVAAVRGGRALLPLENHTLNDEEVLRFARKVVLAIDPSLDAMFPSAVPARIECETRNGSFSRTVLAPRGEPNNPLAWHDLKTKFDVVADKRVSSATATALVDAIAALEAGDISPLLSSLARPMVKEAPDARSLYQLARDKVSS